VNQGVFPTFEEAAVETQVDEIAPDVYRLSTYISDADFMFNQFLVDGEEPLLFQTGLRSLFPLVSAAMERVLPVERLRWITFGHVEADECGSMNSWLAAAPQAQVAHGVMGCIVSVNDLADRPPRPLQDGEVLDLGGRRVRRIETPHVPHGWDAGLFFEETTGTLLCGDLFTAIGDSPALTEQEITGPALAAEDVFRATCLTPSTGPTIRALADLHPATLALMHGPAFAGDCEQALRDLAAAYDDRLAAEGARLHGPVSPVAVEHA
jgi:flavorubredoxin